MKHDFILTANDLSVGYSSSPPTVLLSGLNLRLEGGKLVCLMGPNGSGKSTLIRTLAGLHKPLQGTLSTLDERSIAVVLTDRVTGANMTVLDLVRFGRYPYLDWRLRPTADDLQIVNRSLEQVNIAHLAEMPLHELSDGQMQMAMIARALAQDTPVLLLDEPTAHLDLNNRVETMNLLSKLAHTTGKAILLASHELDLALQTADLVWLATPNKTIKTGIPEDLVLDGSFDEVFQFKGFDLRTGKVNHLPYRGIDVCIIGEGHELLWTRSALERNGFGISIDSPIIITIKDAHWHVGDRAFARLEEVIEELPPSV